MIAKINVSVIHAEPGRQLEVPLQVEPSCTVAVVVQRSGILQQFPHLKMDSLRVGIFSRKVPLDHILVAGDRVEVYRPLLVDPKEARRRRAKSRSQSD